MASKTLADHLSAEAAEIVGDIVMMAASALATLYVGGHKRGDLEKDIKETVGEFSAIILFETLNSVASKNQEDLYQDPVFQSMRDTFKKLVEQRPTPEHRGGALTRLMPTLRRIVS